MCLALTRIPNTTGNSAVVGKPPNRPTYPRPTRDAGASEGTSKGPPPRALPRRTLPETSGKNGFVDARSRQYVSAAGGHMIEWFAGMFCGVV